MLDSAEFRAQVKASRELYPQHWEASRKLMAPESLASTLPLLVDSIQQASICPTVQQCLIEVLEQFGSQIKTKQIHDTLKDLTGLPPSKAVRALMVWGLLANPEGNDEVGGHLSGAQLEGYLREGRNPYDVLLHAQAPSLLDIGAGDLTFEQELVDQYIPPLRSQSKFLTLHAFDRLLPGSQVGGVYHKNQERERYLKSLSTKELHYKFWEGMDVEQFGQARDALPRYTIATCHAPANPTFAFEPTRLDSRLIQQHLQTTRGRFNLTRFDGEQVLEVAHQGQTLTFPPWKFDVIGPLALLQTVGSRSRMAVLSAIDDEVFWEILSQLVEDDVYRPHNIVFTPETLPQIFGGVYRDLSLLTVGEKIDLSTVVAIRKQLPAQTTSRTNILASVKVRYIEVRRGAVWEGVPSSFTARQFSRMREESTPWWIIFVIDV